MSNGRGGAILRVAGLDGEGGGKAPNFITPQRAFV